MHLRPSSSLALIATLSSTLALGACLEAPEEVGEQGEIAEAEQAHNGGHNNSVKRGKKLFEKETFDGNDRTCSSCHRGKHGTISPESVEEIFEENPDDPLFRSIDSDDGVGEDYTRLREFATVRVTIPLPPNLRPLDDLEATHITLFRGVPTMENIALNEDFINYDGGAATLEDQALGAVNMHNEPGRQPTAQELDDMADFQRTLFSSKKLEKFADGGPAPTLPNGNTPREKRGKKWFEPEGACGQCHDGPMLNVSNENFILGPGLRSVAILAGELLATPNPLREWAIIDPDTQEIVEVFPFPFPDPGEMLTTGNPEHVTNFKTPTLWNTKNTAPYFHDGSAQTLEEVVDHYEIMFEIFDIVPPGGVSEQDKKDIVAYMQLL